MKFLNLEKEMFGLDISDKSLKLIKLKKKKKTFVLTSFNQIEIEPGIIEGGVIKNEDALVKIIEALYKNAKGQKITTKYVVASLPEERSFLQVIQMPKMKEEELKSAVIFEAENYIPLPIEEVYLDFQAIPPMKKPMNHFDILLVATPKKIVNSYVSCLKKAGLIPAILEVESQAITRALVKNENSNSHIILIDFGKTSTVFIIFAGSSIQFTCSIPISSDQLTEAIAKALNIDIDKAEKVKETYNIVSKKADTKSVKIQEAIKPILEDLITQIKKYLNFYQNHSFHEHTPSQSDIEKIIICGGGSNLKGLTQFLAEVLEIPVELGNFWTNFPRSAVKKNPKMISSRLRKVDNDIQKKSLSFVTALGLALRGAENMES